MTTVKSLSREMKFFLLALIPIYFISVGLIIQPFDSIVTGIYEIIWEPDFLITDYIASGGSTNPIQIPTRIVTQKRCQIGSSTTCISCVMIGDRLVP